MSSKRAQSPAQPTGKADPVRVVQQGQRNGKPAKQHQKNGANSTDATQSDSDHKPDEGVSPMLFRSLESYLPAWVLPEAPAERARYLHDILERYYPESERARMEKHREYRLKIMSNYKPLYRGLYIMSAANTFAPSFIRAMNEKTEESFRKIVSEPSPGIFTFEMFQPQFCEQLMSEVKNFEKWVYETKFTIMRPNTMNKYGAVLDDFGMETMLQKLMKEFVVPLSNVFFADVGGRTLDSHHGYVVEYGIQKDTSLGFHVDDSEVTLNICLGKQFSGGELFFRGVRCDNHVNTGTQPDEVFDYSHVPGHAILHRGHHRHGARATTAGTRTNLVLWCRSSAFRELRKYQKNAISWCGECRRIQKEQQRLYINATKLELLRRVSQTAM